MRCNLIWPLSPAETHKLFPITYFSYTLTHEIICLHTRLCLLCCFEYTLLIHGLKGSFHKISRHASNFENTLFLSHMSIWLSLIWAFPCIASHSCREYSLFCDRMLGSSTFLGSRKNVKVQLHINTWTTAVSLKLQNKRLYFEEKMRYSSVYERWG